MMRGPALGLLLAVIAGAASAQLYRWTDETGRVHITDTPPPASAHNAQRINPPGNVAESASQPPFELAEAMREFPVTLYTSPNCIEPCAQAREALNKRGVPFKEIQVGDEGTMAELKSVAGEAEVPSLVVGRSVHRGFEQGAFDALLDAARYPKASSWRPRAEADPAKAEVEEPKPTGPYAPGAPPQRTQKK
jgi:glutaredoxin